MVTISVKYALVCLVLIALLVLLIILCIVAVRLIRTVDELNKVLEDASVVSDVAATRTTQLDGIISDVGIAANQVKEKTSDSSLFGAVTGVSRAVTTVAGRRKSKAEE